MLFNSPIFLFIFLPALIAVYFLAGRRLRNVVLLAASWLFYVWGEPVFFPLLFFTILINYAFGRWIGRRQEAGQNARRVVLLAVAANLIVLLFFKYSFFIVYNLHVLSGSFGSSGFPQPFLDWLYLVNSQLPLGISFFTFQAVSYVLDVYRKANPPERSLFRLAFYLSLFPELISGPLVRFREINKQIDNRDSRVSDVAEGTRRFVFGLSKKVLIAGPLGKLVDSIVRSPALLISPSVAWLAMIAYTLQIYYDFAGYTDMAIGVARIFGIRLPENFNYPYISQSITEFWRRWHITLSNWFRDYVYFPLERSRRKSVFDRYTNILIVFLLTGLWHGANWNFILWGVAQGAFIVFERSRPGAWFLEHTPRPIRHVYALLAIVFSWTLFRFANLEGSLNFLRTLAGFPVQDALGSPTLFLDNESILVLIVAILFAMPIYPALQRLRERWQPAEGQAPAEGQPPPWAGLVELFSNGVVIVLLVVSIIYLASSTVNAFIYFRF